MTTLQRLKPDEREFFDTVASIIFSNPFTADRTAIEAVLKRLTEPATVSVDHQFWELLPEVEASLSRLSARGIVKLQSVHAADRERLRHVFLFKVFDRYLAQFDALIRAQSRHGAEPLAAEFGREFLRDLYDYGFGDDDALSYLALCYQVRRAYFFIYHTLVGDSKSMKNLRRALWDNVFTADIRTYRDHLRHRMEDFSTLLLGETGTGKGSAAAAIGRSGLIPYDPKSGRFKSSFTDTFITINLSQFSETLIESELFGHRKGAFTGAIDQHEGVFEHCSAYGSLFLDEIGEVSVPVQIKLLNVLQNREFTPVGAHQSKRFSGRVIAATNQSIETLRRGGRFRDDFFYRLCSDVIEVPPLRIRIEQSPTELEQLVSLLVERMVGTPSPELGKQVLDGLRRDLPPDYAWPGNVRELEQAVRRVVLRGSYQPQADTDAADVGWLERAERGQLSAQELMACYCQGLYRQLGTNEEVTRRTELDRRTVKKYVESGRTQAVK